MMRKKTPHRRDPDLNPLMAQALANFRQSEIWFILNLLQQPGGIRQQDAPTITPLTFGLHDACTAKSSYPSQGAQVADHQAFRTLSDQLPFCNSTQ
jgi:hypothetical protein